MTSYVNPFSGQTIQPSQVGYEFLEISTDVSLQWPVNGNNSLIVANIIEVQATTTDLNVFMPAASQVSTGQSILFKNSGSYTFTVVDYSGNTIIAIPSGIAIYVYITDNTTVNGVWENVTFGAGTSSADAATLAGYGLKPISTTLNQSHTLVSYYSDTTFTAANRAEFAVWESGIGTFTLPVAADVGNDWFIIVRNNGSGILTVQPTGTDTIDGNSNQQLQITESFMLVSDGNGTFNSFGYGQAVSFYFTQLAYDVTGKGPVITLSSSEASNLIQEYFGVLTANTDVILPPTVQLYIITNNTTGSYTLTFGTGAVGASTIAISQTQTLILVCDGTNVYNANSATVSNLPSLTLNPGTALNPSLNFLGNTSTGFYLPSTATLGWAIAGVNKMTLDASGLTATLTSVAGGTFP